MMRRRLSLSFLLILLSFAPAFTVAARRVPNLEARDLSGSRQKLSDLRGKIVVLSFWATWCGPCQEELPRLSALAKEYAGKDVQFVAVSIDDPKDRGKIAPFLDKYKIGLTVWVGPNADILGDFGLGQIVPGTVILDQQGEAIGRISGEARDEDVRSRLDWLIGNRTGQQPEAMVKRY